MECPVCDKTDGKHESGCPSDAPCIGGDKQGVPNTVPVYDFDAMLDTVLARR